MTADEELHDHTCVPLWIARRMLALEKGESGFWQDGGRVDRPGHQSWGATRLESGALEIKMTTRWHVSG